LRSTASIVGVGLEFCDLGLGLGVLHFRSRGSKTFRLFVHSSKFVPKFNVIFVILSRQAFAMISSSVLYSLTPCLHVNKKVSK